MRVHVRRAVFYGVTIVGLCASAAPVHAQSRDLGAMAEANGGHARITLQVFVPLVGWVTLPVMQPSIAPTLSFPTGVPVEAEVADVTVPLGAVPLVNASGVSNRALAMPPGLTTSATATSRVAEATLLNGLVRVLDLVAHVELSAHAVRDAAPVVVVTGTTFIQEVIVAGVTLRLGEIPPNTTLPLRGELALPVLGLRVPIPIAATVTLNEQRAHERHGLEVNALRIRGGGTLLGLARLDLDILLGGPIGDATEASSAPGICGPGFSGNVIDSLTCRRFYQCVDGVAFPMRCPAGLAWDNEEQFCTFLERVPRCRGGSR